MNKRIYILIGALFLVSACNGLEERTRDMRYKVDHEYDKMRYRLSNYLYAREGDAPDAGAPVPNYPAKYCYKVPSDIICYRKPQHHLKGQFVAMQGEDGSYYADTPVYDGSEVTVNEGWMKREANPRNEELRRQAISVQDIPVAEAESTYREDDGPINLMP